MARKQRAIKLVDQRTGKAIWATLRGKTITVRRARPFKELNRKVGDIVKTLKQPFPNFELTVEQQATMKNIERRMLKGELTDSDLRKARDVLSSVEYNVKTRKMPQKKR